MNADSRLADRIAACLPAGARTVCVGFSGGLDSAVLLHVLHDVAPTHGISLSALHVHHGLNPRADDWAAHCASLCATLGVPLQIEHVRVERAGRGLEAAARDARHAAFARSAADWVALAHHADDQAETLLMRLLRGAGVRGAAAMRVLDQARRLWRPLLDVPRVTLHDYANRVGLQWIDDDSNLDPGLARNHLRHAVMPLLAPHWPAAAHTLSRAARHFDEAAQLLDQLAVIDADVVKPGTAGARGRLRALPSARARNLLRYLLAQRSTLMPDEDHLGEALRQLCSDADAVHFVCDQSALCAWREGFWLEDAAAPVQPDQCWSGQTQLPWRSGVVGFVPETGEGALHLDPLAGITLGARRGGEHLRPHPARPTRSLKNLFAESGVPPWQREHVPLLRDAQGRVLWVGGVGADYSLHCAAGEQGWQIIWRRGGEPQPD